MSQVRMCDKCGRIFSELADGWQTFTVVTKKKDDHGRVRDELVAMDACPECAFQGTTEPTIKPSITSGPNFTVRDTVPNDG